MSPVECGKFIAKLRKEKSLTQKELAEKIFVTDKAVSKWETGKGYPDVNSLMALSAYFDVSVNELLCGEQLLLNDFIEKADNNIVSAFKESEKIKRKHFILTVLFSVILIIVLFPVLFLLTRVFFSVAFTRINTDSILLTVITFLTGTVLLIVGFLIRKGNVNILHSYHYKNVKNIEVYSREMGVAISLLSAPIFVFSFLNFFGTDIVTQVLSAVLLFGGMIGCIINLIRIQLKHSDK